jgi:hypothetical protein
MPKYQEFNIYVPIDRGLSMKDLVDVCMDDEWLSDGPASSLHPIKRCQPGLAVTKPEESQDVWKFRLSGLENMSSRWPWIKEDWRNQNFDGIQFITPKGPDDDLCKGSGKKRYRSVDFSHEEAVRMRKIFLDQKRYSEILTKRNGCWIVKVSIYPDDCPKEIVESVKSAFDRAGFGKPI